MRIMGPQLGDENNPPPTHTLPPPPSFLLPSRTLVFLNEVKLDPCGTEGEKKTKTDPSIHKITYSRLTALMTKVDINTDR